MDLFDLVRAASPPPTPTARKDGSDAKAEVESKIKRETLSPSSSPMRVSSMFNLEDSDTDTIPRSPLIGDITTPPPLIISLDDEGTEEEGGSYKNTSKLQKSAKYKDEDDTESNSDSDGDDDQDANQLQPLKTKAEQKMFTDAKAAKKQTMAKAGIKRCIVRIKRLKQSEIDHFTQGKAIKHKKNRKRQQSISDCSSCDETPLPTKRPRSSAKVHVKVPLVQNGSKQRSSLNVSRAHTPPPNLKKPLKKVKPFTASKALIKQYGSRFFNCYVKMNRLKDPDVGSSKRIKRKSKSKLSVSFSEAVEILGSKPRKSSSISGTSRQTTKLNSSVPTRLQRVDATGNVLEDIELKPDTVLKSSTSSGGHKKRGRQAACNGGKRTASMLKRPAVRVPVTDLASLRINDSHDEEEAAAPSNDPGEEYIVPNDMPVYRVPNLNRSGTTTPKEIPKRVAEVTTTISDDEDADGSQTECKMKKTAACAKRAKAEDKKEATTEKEDDEQKEAEVGDSELEPVHPEPEERELKTEDPELDDDSTTSSPVLTVLTDEVTTDDILEIQTSIEDVRELHTPPSRRTSPLMTPPSIIDGNRSQRHDSPESDSSFKSADDRESSVAAVQSSLQSLTGRQVSASDSFVDEPPKPPVITASMLGGSQQSSSGAGGMPQPLYSSMVDMPTLDDEIDQIIEPDFQMANSLHSNSRLTMEDILTVFEA